VKYRKNTVADVNVPVGAIKAVNTPVISFNNSAVSAANITSIRDSIEVDNEEPILGQVKAATVDEIRTRAIDAYASQNRAVTKQDYLSLIYRMPAKFGAVRRANILQDRDSLKRNLNLYIVSENSNGYLTQSPSTVKENLKTWLNKYKMINDTVDILDGRVANIGIEFELVGVLDKNPTEILTKAIAAIKAKYAEKLSFGVPFYISEVYKILNDLPEVIDTTSVKIVDKQGTGYNSNNFDVENNISADGRFIKVPEDVVLEIRYPDQDIIGAVV
jgi:hypothetical protein